MGCSLTNSLSNFSSLLYSSSASIPAELDNSGCALPDAARGGGASETVAVCTVRPAASGSSMSGISTSVILTPSPRLAPCILGDCCRASGSKHGDTDRFSGIRLGDTGEDSEPARMSEGDSMVPFSC